MKTTALIGIIFKNKQVYVRTCFRRRNMYVSFEKAKSCYFSITKKTAGFSYFEQIN